ncbi:hypothetical protein RYZ26_08380 [Terasakiella sp. A23]|uniref:hypothetical protein n=1 Tax=Terasakiella sp. FCG-A23 TaxID=3080561 RepID=UPI00295354D5|nr:hypothetical protein [Terasakiella sp. A23]MDV7339605.1 hypothetical protein [Terasakiella sp. A23]
MSSITKSNDFTTAVIAQIHADSKFKCGRSYSDMLIWTRLCRPLTNSEIFALLPVVVRTVWSDEDASRALYQRGAQKLDTFNQQNLAANLVCFRRTDLQNDEITELKTQLAELSHQFNCLSYSVFEMMDRLSHLENENFDLKSELASKGVISNAASVEFLPPVQEAKGHFIPTRFGEPKPLTCQLFRDTEDAAHPLFIL